MNYNDFFLSLHITGRVIWEIRWEDEQKPIRFPFRLENIEIAQIETTQQND